MEREMQEELRSLMVAHFFTVRGDERLKHILQCASEGFFQNRLFPVLRLLREMQCGRVPHIRFLSRGEPSWSVPTTDMRGPEGETIRRLSQAIERELKNTPS